MHLNVSFHGKSSRRLWPQPSQQHIENRDHFLKTINIDEAIHPLLEKRGQIIMCQVVTKFPGNIRANMVKDTGMPMTQKKPLR